MSRDIVLKPVEMTPATMQMLEDRGLIVRLCPGHHPLPVKDGEDILPGSHLSLLRAWAEEAGFSVETFTTQSSFLVRAGILDLMTEGQDGSAGEVSPPAAWHAVKTLIMDEGGMGEAFKVMVLRKT